MMVWLLVAAGVVILIPFFRLMFYILIGGVVLSGLILVEIWQAFREVWE